MADNVSKKFDKLAKLFIYYVLGSLLYDILIIVFWVKGLLNALTLLPSDSVYLIVLLPSLISAIVTFIKINDKLIAKILYAVLVAIVMTFVSGVTFAIAGLILIGSS